MAASGEGRPSRRTLAIGAAAALAVLGSGAVVLGATAGPDLPVAPPVSDPSASGAPVAGPAGAVPSVPATTSSTGATVTRSRTTGPAGSPATSPAATPAADGVHFTPPPAPSLAPALPRSVPTRISIPALGLDTPVVHLGVAADGSIEVPVGGQPVGWFTGSPTPGQRGPAVILAHVTWNGARGAFFHLGEMRAGERLSVTRADGRRVTFRVTRVATFAKATFPTETVYGNTPDAELRLITCGGDYHPGTKEPYADNVVVFAAQAR